MPEKRSVLAEIFLTPEEKRLRSGWRLIGHLMLFILIGVLFIIPSALILPLFSADIDELLLYSAILGFPAVTISVYLARRFLDRRSFASLGLYINPQAVKDLGFGLGLTALMMGLIFVAHLAAGWLTFDGFVWDFEPMSAVVLTSLLWLLIFLLVGWYEELLARGYWLQTLAEGLNNFWAVSISSVVFAVLHLGNPNASLTSALGLIAAGVFLAYAYLRTRSLWLPIGLHIGWNFFQGNVFGFPVSGINTYSLLEYTVTGDRAVTGGAFGPEAGLILFPVLLIGFGLVKWYTKARQVTS
ncbi:MAG: CPBP family intramembrane metalloprotease [Anaerolineales bacterium]|nr:CPBP family intramembrane metalloprotease [Anaerolineales bacterium]